eukprot:2251123-Rhodomonas_salina.1
MLLGHAPRVISYAPGYAPRLCSSGMLLGRTWVALEWGPVEAIPTSPAVAPYRSPVPHISTAVPHASVVPSSALRSARY